jgi:hypothetical protein
MASMMVRWCEEREIERERESGARECESERAIESARESECIYRVFGKEKRGKRRKKEREREVNFWSNNTSSDSWISNRLFLLLSNRIDGLFHHYLLSK